MRPLKPWRRRLASVLGLAAIGCSRDGGHPPASADASPGGSASAARESSAGVHPKAREPPKLPRCHAAWPMPNLVASGLPHPQSYDTSNADVAVDRVTGLSWQRILDPNINNLHRASDYCEGLTLAGHHDWRLPSLIELVSIADTSRADPAIDPVVFPDTPSAPPFWSSQTDITNTGLGWYVSFKNGGAYGGNDIIRLARARCVRGPASCTEDVRDSPYSIGGDSAHDERTGLTWQRSAAHDNYAWQDAKTLCSKLDSGGGGWRLPSLRELLTVVDLNHFDPAVDASVFPGTSSELFWSSTPSLAPAGTAWGVNFTRGGSAAAPVSTKAHVRCAR